MNTFACSSISSFTLIKVYKLPMKDNLNNFQLSVESDPGLLCFSLTSLSDWSR